MKTTRIWDIGFLKTWIQSAMESEDIKIRDSMEFGYKDRKSVKKVIEKRSKTEKYGFFEGMLLKLWKRTQIALFSVFFTVLQYFLFSGASAIGDSRSIDYLPSIIEAAELREITIDSQKVLDVAILGGDTDDITAKTIKFDNGSSDTFTGSISKGILVARVANQETENSVGTAYDLGKLSVYDRTGYTIYLYSVKELDSRVVNKMEQLGKGSVEGVKSPVFVYKLSYY